MEFSAVDEFRTAYNQSKKDCVYDQVKNLAVVLLSAYTSSDQACKGDDVYEEYCKQVANIAPDDEKIAKSTFVQYLSKASHDEGTNILCDGRRQGYYTRKETKVESEDEVRSATDERDLYPLFTNWLSQQGYAAQNVAATRANGQWGNPDVVGVKIFEGIGIVETEIVTIECKKVFDNWKHWIFEAVAHTRFADRSYFAFAFPEDEIDKWSDELVKYAEYFGVGVLVLEVTSDAYEGFKRGQTVGVCGDNIRVLVHARKNRPLIEDKIAFMNGLGIKSFQSLMQFLAASPNVVQNKNAVDECK